MTPEDAASVRGSVASLPTGRYRYDVAADVWTVAPAALQLLGLAPDCALHVAGLLGLLPDEEREEVARFVLDAIRRRVPFSTLLPVRRPDGDVREVLVVGEGAYDGEVLVAVHGHVVDVEAIGAERADERIDRAVAEVVANRATIEQAKGALSLAYGFDGEAAFALLRWWSNHRNVKVKALAERLLTEAGTGAVSTPALRAAVDGLLASTSRPDTSMDARSDAPPDSVVG
jgi:hypothetical protein